MLIQDDMKEKIQSLEATLNDGRVEVLFERLEALQRRVDQLEGEREKRENEKQLMINFVRRAFEKRINTYERKWATKIAFLNGNVTQELYAEE